MIRYQVNVYCTTAGVVEVEASSMRDAENKVKRIVGKFETCPDGRQELPGEFFPHSHEFEVDNVEEMFKV